MFNLDQVINPYVERIKPHALHWSDRVDMFMCGVIDRLDRIADAVSDDDNTEFQRRYPVVNLAANVVTNVAGGASGEIPPNEEWELENITGTLDAATTARLYASASDAQAGALPLAVLTISGAGAFATQGGNKLFIQGGTTPVLVSTGNGSVRLQFRCQRRTIRRPGTGGILGVVPDRRDAGQEAALERRHAGTFTQGRNVIGERVADL
jgi:hypothetical protein